MYFILIDNRKNFFEKLKVSCHNIDAIFLVLHGAMVSTNHDDFEGDFLRDIQSFLSKENIFIPIVAVLDLHANVSENMINEIKDASTGDGGSGAFYIFLKKNKSIK